MAYGNDLDMFLSQLQSLILSLVVKRDDYANKYETVQSRASADRYIAMIEGGSNWDSFVIFDYDVLKAAGLSDDIIRAIYAENKELIPPELRDLICRLQKEKVLSEYVEVNTYYRMLHGEPPIDATEDDFVYIPKNDYGIPTDVPVHLLNEGYIQYFNSSGLRESLYMANKDKPYLLFMGSHQISYYTARVARNFEILYFEHCENREISESFVQYYANCRNYVMRNLYNKPDQKMYEYYDAFMGFITVHMATQRLFTTIFPQGIRRNFYDDNLIRCLFEAYNIPYIESIDIPYQKSIAKKLNILLQKKASNMVLFDIASIFHYNDINIYKYYLVKDFYKDENGDPVIIYKTIYDENNEPHIVIDPEKTFDIYFQKVNIKSKDIPAEIGDNSNRIEYEAICGGDPYWINDADLLNKIYNSKFNNILTKYMSIDVSYELARLMYETTHGLRMIIDDQEDYKRLFINLPYVSEPVSLYDTVIFLCALVSKKFGLAGNVPLKPYQIAQVYGFNFKTDIDMLKMKILEDIESCTGEYRAVREELLGYLKTLNTTTLEGVREMYNNIEKLRIWLDTAMRYSNDIEEYEAYMKIYNSVLLTRDIQELYTKNDGSFASTYAELLEDRRPDLYEVLKKSGNPSTVTEPGTTTDYYEADFSVNNKINKTLEKLSMISDELADMKYINDKDALVSNIEKVINQFKSYTVDQTQSSVMYLLNDPHMCMLKLIDSISGSALDTNLASELKILWLDTIDQILITRKWEEILPIRDAVISDKLEYIKDVITVFDKIALAMKWNTTNWRIALLGVIHKYSKDVKLAPQLLDMSHVIDATGKWNIRHLLPIWDKIVELYKQNCINEDSPLVHILKLSNLVDIYHYLEMIHLLTVNALVDINHVLSLDVKVGANKAGNVNANLLIDEYLLGDKDSLCKSPMEISDKVLRKNWEFRWHRMFIDDTVIVDTRDNIRESMGITHVVGSGKSGMLKSNITFGEQLLRREVIDDD